MSVSGDLPRLGLAVSTIGRTALADLLRSVERSSVQPVAVAIANQSGRRLDLDPGSYAFPVVVVPSDGGVSQGRNDAVAALPDCDVLGFPNDDSVYDLDTARAVLECFAREPAPAAVACRLQDPTGPRFRLPPPGTLLDRRTVWLAIEPSMFVRREVFARLGGFAAGMGTGAPSMWRSGEGTDLLLRVLAGGGRVVSRPDVVVRGPGEKRLLDAGGFVAKHRAYARGTGHVYRVHGYPWTARLRILAGPWARPAGHDPDLRLSLRLAVARSLGRLEGLIGRPVGRASRQLTWDGPPEPQP